MTGETQERPTRAAQCADTIKTMAAQKYTSSQIADAIGMQKSTINNFCRRAGIRLNTNPYKSPRPRAITLRHSARKHGVRWNGPAASKVPGPDISIIGCAIDYMRRFYPCVYHKRTVTGDKSDDRIVCGSKTLPAREFLEHARKKGFGL